MRESLIYAHNSHAQSACGTIHITSGFVCFLFQYYSLRSTLTLFRHSSFSLGLLPPTLSFAVADTL